MKLRPALALTLILLIHSVFSQTVNINNNCKLAYEDILSLKFKDATQRIEIEKVSNPDNIFIPYLENYIDFLKVTVGEDEELFKLVEDSIQYRINRINSLPDNSKYKKYFIGNINLQWATAQLKFGNYATGAIGINRSYRLIKKNNNEYPNFIPNSITLGILHIIIGLVPDSFDWFLNIISMEGDVQQGYLELIQAYEDCSKNSRFDFLKNEILFYTGMVDLNLKPNPEIAKLLLSDKIIMNKDNLLLTYLSINILMKNGKNNDALELFNSFDFTNDYYPFYYLNYLHGDCYLRKLNTKKAIEEYQIFKNNFKGQNYIKDAWQKIAWCELINSDTIAYLKAMDNVLLNGETNIDADKSAEQSAKNKELIPNVELLKSRLLFDGGYYESSKELLLEIPEHKLTSKQLVEKNYRLARISHEVADYKNAKKYYSTTIETGRLFPEYLAANSALKLGNIYEIEKNTKMAVYYYQLCLEIDFDEYRNSIRGKAKQGLLRVNNK